MREPAPLPLRAVPRTFYSWDYRILDGDREVALVDLGWFRERGRFTLDGEDYLIQREGIARGRWFLRSGDRVLASAEKASAFRRNFEITVTDRRLSLRPVRLFSRSFVLLHGRQPLGSIVPVRPLSRKAFLDLPADLPLAVRIFVSFLVMTLWKRAAAAASSG